MEILSRGQSLQGLGALFQVRTNFNRPFSPEMVHDTVLAV